MSLRPRPLLRAGMLAGAAGPVQLLIIAFRGDRLSGEITAELARLRENPAIRLLDLVLVAKDEGGRLRVVEMAEVNGGSEPGRYALKVLDAGNADLSHLDGAHETELWNAADAIPMGAVVAVALIEHRWAIALRDTIRHAGGTPVTDAWLAPQDVASIGL